MSAAEPADIEEQDRVVAFADIALPVVVVAAATDKILDAAAAARSIAVGPAAAERAMGDRRDEKPFCLTRPVGVYLIRLAAQGIDQLEVLSVEMMDGKVDRQEW